MERKRVLTKANGSVDTYAIAGDDIYFIGLQGLRLQELYLLKDEEEIQLTKFNENIIESKKLSIPEKFDIDGMRMKDGSETYRV